MTLNYLERQNRGFYEFLGNFGLQHMQFARSAFADCVIHHASLHHSRGGATYATIVMLSK